MDSLEVGDQDGNVSDIFDNDINEDNVSLNVCLVTPLCMCYAQSLVNCVLSSAWIVYQDE